MVSLKKTFDISFGHMVVFKDDRYFMVSDNAVFKDEFLNNVQSSSIFCKQNISNPADPTNHGYNFTLWPDQPSDQASTMCFKHNQWHGITISKSFQDHTALWWFGSTPGNHRAQEFYINNKHFLIQIIHFFNSFKNQVHLPKTSADCSNVLGKGFDISAITNQQNIIESVRIKQFLLNLNHRIIQYRINNQATCRFNSAATQQTKIALSAKELQILSFISKGLSAKSVALHIDRSHKTIEHHIANIKVKLNLNYKADLIRFYFDNVESRSNTFTF